MTREEALALLAVQAQASTPPALTESELNAALTASRLPDNDGRGPADPDFVEENWDVNYATALCYENKHVKLLSTPRIKKFTAEGATFEKEAPDFQAVADWWRDRSSVGDSSSPTMVEFDNKLPWRLRPRSSLEC
jgi:hypothetical protein